MLLVRFRFATPSLIRIVPFTLSVSWKPRIFKQVDVELRLKLVIAVFGLAGATTNLNLRVVALYVVVIVYGVLAAVKRAFSCVSNVDVS